MRHAGIPNDIVRSSARIVAAPPLYYLTDGIKELHRRGIKGQGNRLGLGDTGGTSTHPDLPPPIKKIDNTVSGGNGNDRNSHGTATHFIAFAVAPEAEFITIKVLGDSGSGRMDWINRSYRQAADEGCNFYNGSYGDNGGPPIDEDIRSIQAGYDHGLQLINFAAGNAGFNGRQNSIGRPASYGLGSAIGSTDRFDKISGYSSGGPQLDFACYGQNMTYASPNGGYSTGSGTSFSCPYFCGICMLVNQVRKRLKLKNLFGITQWRQFFVDNDLLVDAGRAGEDPSFGLGIPDIGKIIAWMLNNTIKWF